MKKMFSVFALVSVFCATAAFAAPREAHSWAELQELCRVQLAARDEQGNATSDGGKLGHLRWDTEWRITDDWKVLSGSSVYRRTGEVLPAGSEFYAWFIGGADEPTTPTSPEKPDTKKEEEPVEISSFEELQTIASGDIKEENNDGGRKALLLKPLRVAPGQVVYCESATPLNEGDVAPAGKTIYIFLAPEGYGLPEIVDVRGLRKVGDLEQQDDGVWYNFATDEVCKISTDVIAVFDVDSGDEEVTNGLLREGHAYVLVFRAEFLNFVPKNVNDLRILAQPGTEVKTGPTWEPTTGTIQNYFVTPAADWRVPSNVEAYWGKNDNGGKRSTGDIASGGTEIMVNVTPIADPDKGGNGGGNSGDGGGGGCDAGLGLPALALVGLALRKQRR